MATYANLGCKTEGCGRVAVSRGLCRLCLGRLTYDIKRGKTTYKQAEEFGRCLPAKTRRERTDAHHRAVRRQFSKSTTTTKEPT